MNKEEINEKLKELLWDIRVKVTRKTDREGMIHVDDCMDFVDKELGERLFDEIINNKNQ